MQVEMNIAPSIEDVFLQPSRFQSPPKSITVALEISEGINPKAGFSAAVLTDPKKWSYQLMVQGEPFHLTLLRERGEVVVEHNCGGAKSNSVIPVGDLREEILRAWNSSDTSDPGDYLPEGAVCHLSGDQILREVEVDYHGWEESLVLPDIGLRG